MPLVRPDISSVPFVARLGSFGDRAALITPDEVVSYADLAARVASVAERLGTERRLVLVAGGNQIDPLVSYLAALAAGHPVILVPGDNPGNVASVVEAYDPDVVVAGGCVDERRPGSRHELHPDLALLLSTSGSTGSPKLVRLSRVNVQSNAEAIASYLGIRDTDRAATTMPMHYCYGLSVINSHLTAGAALILTDLSVVDACFWDTFRAQRGTTLAGVPYTFDLLDRVGFAQMDLPHLRYVTQAGGRLAPERVRRYAELGQRNGWDLFVMYGQTEATARMAYLPPDLATSAPSTIGVPIPGGSFRLDPLPERPLSSNGAVETGELVYTGDNVMLGYATSAADLSLGRSVTELRTGDVARRTPAGLVEIIGRRNRFAKIFGLRIDLDATEAVYAGEGVTAFCADGDNSLVVAVDTSAKPVDTGVVEQVAKDHFGLPHSAVQVLLVPEVPRLPTGKPDYRRIVAMAEKAVVDGAAPSRPVGNLRALYADVLNRSDVRDTDTFVSLEGDSLSYVEMSIRLEEALGHLPQNWHVTPIGELSPTTSRGWKGWRSVETNVLLRAAAILLIVGSHVELFALMGGAHILLAVAGFNFGRFQVTAARRVDRLKRTLGSVSRIVAPSVAWIAGVVLLTREYDVRSIFLLNGIVGSDTWTDEWQFWFIEALVYTLLALTVLLAVPVVHRLEQRSPFWFAMGLVALGLLTRYGVVTMSDGPQPYYLAHVIFFVFALGWATVKATSTWHRVVVSAAVLATLPGFFGDPARELLVAAGMLLLVWVSSIPVPSLVARAAGVLATASLYIYLSQWMVYPHLEKDYPLLALLASVATGVAFWVTWSWLAKQAGRVPSYLSWGRPEITGGRSRFSQRRYSLRESRQARC